MLADMDLKLFNKMHTGTHCTNCLLSITTSTVHALRDTQHHY